MAQRRVITLGVNQANVRTLLLVLFLVGCGWAVTAGVRPRADTLGSAALTGDAFFSNRTIPIVISANGTVTINGTAADDTVRRLSNVDELRLPVLDATKSPVQGGSGVVLRLTSPVPFTISGGYPLAYAIHGATLASDKPNLVSDRIAEWTIVSLSSEGAISLAAQFPRGSFNLSTRVLLRTLPTLEPWWVWSLAGLGVLGVIAVLVWFKNRSWETGKSVGLVGAPPSTLSPAAAGALLAGTAGPAQLAAILVTMATRGDIQLVQSPEGYRVARRREVFNLSQAEQILLNELRLGLGPITQQEKVESDLAQKMFDAKITEAYADLVEELRLRGLFAPTAGRPQLWYRFLAVLCLATALVGAVGTAWLIPGGTVLLPFWAGFFLGGWLLFARTPTLPPLTAVGQQERDRWLGFRAWLADPSAIRGNQADADQFIDYLPYAVSFDVVPQWLARFNQDFIIIPTWYFNTSDPGSTHQFVADIHHITSQIAEDLHRAALPS